MGVCHSVGVVLGRLSMVFVIGVAAVLGVVLPDPGALLQPFTTVLVVFLVYASLRSFEAEEFSMDSVGLVLVGMLLSYMVVPFTAEAIGSLLLGRSTLMGVIVIAVGPTTAGSAVIWTRLSDGDVTLSLMIATTSILITPVVMPALISYYLAEQVAFSSYHVVGELVIIVGGGLFLTLAIPEDTLDEISIDRAALVAIAALVYIGVATSPLTGSPIPVVLHVAVTTIAVTGTVFALSTAVGTVLRLNRYLVRGLFFAGSLKNLGIAVIVVPLLAVGGEAMIGAVTFYVTQQIASSVIAEFG